MSELEQAVRSAAAAGIVTASQAERLIGHFASLGLVAAGSAAGAPAGLFGGLSAPRDDEPVPQVEESESPRLIRGFHDVLITIGVIAAAVGLWLLAGVWPVLAAIIAMAEILVRRQRLALPAFTLTVLFVIALFVAVTPLLESFGETRGEALVGLTMFLVQPVALAPFYWRYRVPVALAAMILTGFWVGFFLVLALVEAGLGTRIVFATHQVLISLVGLFFALALFAVAMAFDLRDPARLTRRSDVAFWLHLCAAPALFYSIVLVLLQPEDGVIWWNNDPGLREALVAVGVVAVMMLVGIVIDRRAFVTAGLISLGAAILVLARVVDLQITDIAAVAILVVGIIVLVLGIGWTRMRRVLLSALPGEWRRRLPPVAG